jgi:hypothetical protein
VSGMLDSVFTSVHRSVILLDLVDDAWAADCLSDDGMRPGVGQSHKGARSRRAPAPASPARAAAPDAGLSAHSP